MPWYIVVLYLIQAVLILSGLIYIGRAQKYTLENMPSSSGTTGYLPWKIYRQMKPEARSEYRRGMGLLILSLMASLCIVFVI